MWARAAQCDRALSRALEPTHSTLSVLRAIKVVQYFRDSYSTFQSPLKTAGVSVRLGAEGTGAFLAAHVDASFELKMADTYAVIGGEGFLGHALVTALHERYSEAKLLSLDVVQRHYPQKGEWEFRSCDLTDEESLSSALGSGISGVFHTASPHIGGTKELCEKVNVEGTRNIVDVCRKLGIKKLVYTSSAGIPFDCTDLINVDERCTPAPKPIDPYNDTKVNLVSLGRSSWWQDIYADRTVFFLVSFGFHSCNMLLPLVVFHCVHRLVPKLSSSSQMARMAY